MPEIAWYNYWSSNDESVIVHWESQYGTLARNPEENYYTFLHVAQALETIHENDHDPSVGTVVVGSEELAASYDGLHNDDPERAECSEQAPFVDEITEFAGWYTMTRVERGSATFLPDDDPLYLVFGPQDRYEEWAARAIRTFLQDAANEDGFEDADDHAWLENLQYVTIIGDGDRVPASFYYHYEPLEDLHIWLPTDFFYSTQDDTAEVGTTPRYQVGRIPIRRANNPGLGEPP